MLLKMKSLSHLGLETTDEIISEKKTEMKQSPGDDCNNDGIWINAQYIMLLKSKCVFLELRFCQFQIKTEVRFLAWLTPHVISLNEWNDSMACNLALKLVFSMWFYSSGAKYCSGSPVSKGYYTLDCTSFICFKI